MSKLREGQLRDSLTLSPYLLALDLLWVKDPIWSIPEVPCRVTEESCMGRRKDVVHVSGSGKRDTIPKLGFTVGVWLPQSGIWSEPFSMGELAKQSNPQREQLRYVSYQAQRGGRRRGPTELGGKGGECWQEFDLLLSCCPESSLSAWEPGREAGLISLWSQRWEFFFGGRLYFPGVVWITPAPFHLIRSGAAVYCVQWTFLHE